MTLGLEQIKRELDKLPPEKRAIIEKDIMAQTKNLKFIPNAGPQTLALLTPADILLYGGSAGSGKSALILGCALSHHTKSLIMRRRYSDLEALTSEICKMNGTRKGFSGSPPPKLRTGDGRLIEFGACNLLGDEEAFQGRQHDLKAFDEVTQFLEQQVRYIMTWNRTVDMDQRTRTIFASNPPTSAEGDWIIPYFGPWLIPNHEFKAEYGELRWVVSDPEGHDFWVPGPEPYQFPDQDKPVIPKSRTFIPGTLADNPYLVATGYAADLDALPEPLRSAMRDGNFMLSRSDAEGQVIPAEWVRAAQARWKANPHPPEGIPMSSIVADCAQGGADENIIQSRYGNWFSSVIAIPGRETPVGTDIAAPILLNRKDLAVIGIDIGGGYGSTTYKALKDNDIKPHAFDGRHSKFLGKTIDGRLKFHNRRSRAYWRLREALDPSQPGGSTMALPVCPKLFADLTAPTFGLSNRGIQVERKKDIKKRLGRSTDRGDGVAMCWDIGPKSSNPRRYIDEAEHGTPRNRASRTPKINRGYPNRRRR